MTAKIARPAVAQFATAVFAAGCLAGAGTITSCEVRSTTADQCAPAWWRGLALVVAGAGIKGSFEAGYGTPNPALDVARRALAGAELPAAAGAAPPDPEPPEWALDPRLVLTDHEADS